MSGISKQIIKMILGSKDFGKKEKESVEIDKLRSGRLLVRLGTNILGYIEDGKFAHGMASQLLTIEMLRDIANKMEKADIKEEVTYYQSLALKKL